MIEAEAERLPARARNAIKRILREHANLAARLAEGEEVDRWEAGEENAGRLYWTSCGENVDRRG